ISRIAFCKGRASWFGTFLELQYNEISKPEVARFSGFLLRNISNSKRFPEIIFFLGAISRFPLQSFFALAFFKPTPKKGFPLQSGLGISTPIQHLS
ncbi:MAG: hypothetical protein J6N74_05855, partial [Chryseobacterium sp.]|nr:hypothetical protein [Chryseobacterium sp.]